MKKVRHLIFLKDVLLLSLLSFGGPQAHIALFFKILVKKRGYITEEELIDLNSFCNILPGPASTQTLTAIGYRIGGPKLAFLTLLVWILPAVSVMITAAIAISFFPLSETKQITRFIQPMAVGFVAFAAYKISSTVIKTKISNMIFIVSAVVCYFIKTPAIFPLMLIAGGFITSFRFREQPLEEKKHNEKLNIEWGNLILYVAIFVGAALLGMFTRRLPEDLPISLPIRLFENFFRNGSIIFGGGEALSALFYKEFVEFKGYLNDNEFLSGFALLRTLPGPLFAFSSYVGALSMRTYGVPGEVIGGIAGAIGIFLPGTLMIFFIIRFWDKIKTNRVIRASFEGINATNAGIVTATAIILFKPLESDILNYPIVAGTFCLLLFTKFPPPLIILLGLLSGTLFFMF